MGCGTAAGVAELMEFTLDAYAGPLDLLLRLIARNEIDIYDIPIAQLTDQYLAVLAEVQGDPDMEQMSEFLVMAATLLEIKSRMLLPRPKPQDDGIEPEDPRELLVQKLLAYQQAQMLAAKLEQMTPMGERLPGTGEPALADLLAEEPPPILEDISLQQLWEVFGEVMARRAAKTDTVRAGYGEMPRERFTIPEKVSYIRHILQQGPTRLFALLEDCRSKNEMIVTFLAVLEMVRRGMIQTQQEHDFADILCERRTPYADDTLPTVQANV